MKEPVPDLQEKITVAVEIKDKKIVAITILNVEADDAAFFQPCQRGD